MQFYPLYLHIKYVHFYWYQITRNSLQEFSSSVEMCLLNYEYRIIEVWISVEQLILYYPIWVNTRNVILYKAI